MLNKRIRNLLPRFIIIYMLLALLWWALLLFQKNSALTTQRLKVLQIESNLKYQVNNYDIGTLESYDNIISKHKRQQMMIIGEGLVFGISLIIGITLINRAHLQEIANNLRQKNFLLSITHELKSPLASIGLIFETLKRRSLKSDQIKELAESGLSENKRLESQINNMLFATRLEEAYKFNFEEIDLNKMIAGISNHFNSIHQHEIIKLDLPGHPIFIQADVEGIRSVLVNIIDNAIKYNIQKPLIHLKVNQGEHSTEISIKDNGIGIPNAELEKVTDKFYRVGSEETRNTKGTGLGLFIVKKIIDAHSGRIAFYSTVDVGTKVLITIPNKRI
ncbi:MAG: HAMP domain-containing histidine kinase [Saprospiraceae bacterium]|nr:HAMP domain-containing histidine kinase [Saprospiraceae bacterium]